jgi:hypothetical protein
MTVEKTEAQPKLQPAARRKAHQGIGARLGRLILPLLIPFALSMTGWYLAVDTYQLWDAALATTPLLFIATIAGLSLLASLVLIGLGVWYRRTFPSVRRQPGATKQETLLRLIVGGLLLPAALAAGIAFTPVLNHQTFLALLVRSIQAQTEYLFLPDIAQAVTSAQSRETRVAGIQTLATLGSLDELLAIVEQEPQLLDDWLYYNEMVKALSAFELRARQPLLDLFYKYEQQARGSEAKPQPDLHTRFFKQTFEALKQQLETEGELLEPAKKAELMRRLEAIELELKQGLQDLEAEQPFPQRGEAIPNLALDTFLAMESLQQDSEIYFLAKEITGDPTYSTGIRASAILLLAKLGSEADFALLLPHLKSENEILKHTALTAIANLYEKVGGPKSNE